MKLITITLLAAAVSFTGCARMKKAAEAKVLVSNPRSVVIQSFDGVEDAQQYADAECKKHGRFARVQVSAKPTVKYVFDCVE